MMGSRGSIRKACMTVLTLLGAMLLSVSPVGATTLTVAWETIGLTEETRLEIIAEFEQMHGVTIEHIDAEPQLLISRFAAGLPVDVLQANAGQNTTQFVDMGVVRPLDDYISRTPGILNEWFPQLLEVTKVGGRMYWIPRGEIDVHSVLWLNEAMLQDAGLIVPGIDWTFDEFEEMAAKMRADENGDGLADRWLASVHSWLGWTPYYFNGGGRFVDPNDPSRVVIGEPASLEALEWLRDVHERDLLPRDSRLRAIVSSTHQSTQYLGLPAFGEYRVAGATESSRKAVRDIVTQDIDGAATLVPRGPGGQHSLVEFEAFAISSTSQEPDLAWAWIMHLTKPEVLRHMIVNGRTPTVNRNLITDYFEMDFGITQLPETIRAFFERPVHLYRPILNALGGTMRLRIVPPIIEGQKAVLAAVEEYLPSIQAAYDEYYAKTVEN